MSVRYTVVVLFLSTFGPRVSVAAETVEANGFEEGLGWTLQVDTSGSAHWQVVTLGTNPDCLPEEGTSMAEFNSYTADWNTWANLSSPALDLTGAEVATMRFFMYRDPNRPNNLDLLRMGVSTDGGNKYFLLYEFPRYHAFDAEWQEISIPLGGYTGRDDLRIKIQGLSRYGNNIYLDDIRITKDILANGANGKACQTNSDCDSNICGLDPLGQGRCRDPSWDCVDLHRQGVSTTTTQCYDSILATCSGIDSWSVTDCRDDCGAYPDVSGCGLSNDEYICEPCSYSCIFDYNCDENAYCSLSIPWGCQYKKEEGESCSSSNQCLSNNCARTPSSAGYCQQLGVFCSNDQGGPVSLGSVICAAGDVWECQLMGWVHTDCFTNCGFYQDVDECNLGVCTDCPQNCTQDEQCKPGILCNNGSCEGELPPGSTCQLSTQCASANCVDGRCCKDSCMAPCHRCDLNDSGDCQAIEEGSDPDSECNSDETCAGFCDGQGACTYTAGNFCDICTRCDDQGRCTDRAEYGTDPNQDCQKCYICSGEDASCIPVPRGEDLLEQCEISNEACGLDGSCDGQGNCQKQPQDTPCSQANCSNGISQPTDTCDGEGQCQDAGYISCAPYRCADSTECATSCQAHSACLPSAFCSAQGACEYDLIEGSACEGVVLDGLLDDAACQNGYCFQDNFDGQGAFCSQEASACVHDGLAYSRNYALCAKDKTWYRLCEGGAKGWNEKVSCQAGPCDAGGGERSGVQSASECISGPNGGCSGTCTSCRPYKATADGHCIESCKTDEDCWQGFECDGTGQCQVPEGIGERCNGQADCFSGICVDGRCCQNSCTGDCRACNLPGYEGFCTFVSKATDPDEDCAAQSNESCGNTGVCDGNGACQLWAAGQLCAEAHCLDNWFSKPANCDGIGNCIVSANENCGPGRCTDSGCDLACSEHSDCQRDGFCSADSTCQPDLVDGADCQDVVRSGLSAHPACLGGYCIKDNYLDQGARCTSQIDACVAFGESYPVGFRLCNADAWYRTCLGGEYGWDIQVLCEAASVCDAGAGIDSGIMPAQTCRSGIDGGCEAPCISCRPYRAEAMGICKDECSEDRDCWPGYHCVEPTCIKDDGLGAQCQQDADCQSNHCVEGVCCNLTCDEICTTCIDSLATGICINAKLDTDPREDCQAERGCGQTGECDGLAGCQLKPSGTECQANTCVNGIYTSPALCDGQGNCQAGRQHTCASGVCSDQSCALDAADGGIVDGDSDSTDVLQAEAGPIQQVRPKVQVTLDGSGSFSSTNQKLTFRWQVSSSPIELSMTGTNSPQATFTPEREGVYVFSLTVTDQDQNSDVDFTEVHVIAGRSGCSHNPKNGGAINNIVWSLGLLAALGRRRRWFCRTD